MLFDGLVCGLSEAVQDSARSTTRGTISLERRNNSSDAPEKSEPVHAERSSVECQMLGVVEEAKCFHPHSR